MREGEPKYDRARFSRSRGHTIADNLAALMNMPGQWVDRIRQRCPIKEVDPKSWTAGGPV
jgi:hypothetical protein